MSTNIGYKKNTVDYIPELGTETGYLNKSQATELIKQYTQDIEFYEIEPAEVVACHLNPNREDFPKINGKPDLSKMGCIEVSLLHSQSSGEVFDSFIKPLSRAIVQFPVAGEIVNVAQYDDDFYYYFTNGGSVENPKIPHLDDASDFDDEENDFYDQNERKD